MRGLFLDGGELILRSDLPRPTPGPDEALVRVLRAGICSTDHGLVDGLYPFRGILGHEFVGVVEEGPEELRGARVVGEINVACRRCDRCLAGLSRHCAERTVVGIIGRDGAFAESIALPVANLLRVPDAVSDEAAVFTEPLAAALEILEQTRVEPGCRVLLVGPGKLGQLIAQVLAQTGCDLLVLGRGERKLGILRELGIATTTEAPEPGSFDIAVECTGDELGFAIARQSLRPRGTLVLKSTYPGRPAIDTTMLVVDEITLLGSRCGPFAPALRLLESGRIQTQQLEDANYPLDDALRAFARSREPNTLKVTLSVGT